MPYETKTEFYLKRTRKKKNTKSNSSIITLNYLYLLFFRNREKERIKATNNNNSSTVPPSVTLSYSCNIPQFIFIIKSREYANINFILQYSS